MDKQGRRIPCRPTWIEVNLDNLVHNYRVISDLVAPARVMPIIKAEAYGHGAVMVAKTLKEEGATYFGVATLTEALQLSRAGVDVPILILGWVPLEDLVSVFDYDYTVTVFSWEQAERLSVLARERNKEVRIHIKLDTGMGRLGFTGEDALRTVIKVSELPGLVIEGLFTHFAVAEENEEYTLRQIELFEEFSEGLKANGIFVRYRHAANSAGLLEFPAARYDFVRPGLILYGYYPGIKKEEYPLVKPVLSWKARVAQVKGLPEGAGISYGLTYYTEPDDVIGTVPVGYADGYRRALGNRGYVLSGGRQARVVGRVCMDQFMIKLKNVEGFKQGDEVTLLGEEGNARVTAEDMAEWLNTISYEVLTGISKRVPRGYYRDGNLLGFYQLS